MIDLADTIHLSSKSKRYIETICLPSGRHANDADGNAIKWITRDRANKTRVSTDTREMNPVTELRMEAEPWMKLWGKTGEEKPQENILVEHLEQLGLERQRRHERIRLEGVRLHKRAKEKHKSSAGPDGWTMAKQALLPTEWFNELAGI